MDFLTHPDFLKTIGIIAVVAFIALLIMGATNKVVIYYNVKDYLISIAPYLAIIAGIIFYHMYTPEESTTATPTFMQYVVIILSCILVVWFSILTYINAIKYNTHPILGVIIGTMKLIVACISVLLSIILITGAFIKGKPGDKSVGIVAVIALGIIALLINGERVYNSATDDEDV